MRFSLLVLALGPSAFGAPSGDLGLEYRQEIRPRLERFCLGCHSTAKKKGDLDLERFGTLEAIERDLRPWPLVVENLDSGEMPPKKSAQPAPEDRARISTWVRAMLDAEARARAGDPGRVILRRLSNAEYNNTLRDLTGVDFEPARDFPADGAAGEGFTNVGDALVMSPPLLGKYLGAAKEIADHLVLLPDGFRFSPSKTRRDWTDEALVRLRAFYAPFSSDGRLPLKPYLAATVRHRDELLAGRTSPEAVAAREHLNSKFFGLLWQALSGTEPSYPLDGVRARWRGAGPGDIDAVLAQISAWQDSLWKSNKIGSYGGGKLTRQEAAALSFVASQTLRMQPKAEPGKGDVRIYLATVGALGQGEVVWRQPRFQGGKEPPLLLRDYGQYGPRYELDPRAVFAEAARYLSAATRTEAPEGLDPSLLSRWKELLGLGASALGPFQFDPARSMPAGDLELLDVPAPRNAKWPAIRGWQTSRGELPVALSNASDEVQHIPGLASPHRIVVHPSPDRFVAAGWTSPVDGRLRVEPHVRHVHPGCGNGILWWVEMRRQGRSSTLAEGVVDPGQPAQIAAREVMVATGDEILIAIDPRDGNHVCDLTEINLGLTELGGQARTWDLARDRADSILERHPSWRFVAGPVQKRAGSTPHAVKIPPDSLLGKWKASPDPKLALEVQALLSGDRPTKEKSPDRALYDALVSVDSPFFQGLDLGALPRPPSGDRFGLDPKAFSSNGDVVVPAGTVLEVRLPAALFRERELVVEGALGPDAGDRIVQFQGSTAAPRPTRVFDAKSPCVASGEGPRLLARGFEAFRSIFPGYLCYPRIVPDDEVVCLKLYHREDEPLVRLFLDPDQTSELERLWKEHRFITQWPVTEWKNLPLFIGFVTQDGGAEAVKYFESLREPFRKRAEEFEAEVRGCEPAEIDRMFDFAERAFRRPLAASERERLSRLYGDLREKGLSHAQALQGVLVRILVSPAFLFKVETPAAGTEARAVSGSELATRLSYFLWASAPDPGLARDGARGRLNEPAVLSAQVARMVQDPRVRGLAAEFAAQWLHVRNFRENREKNEKLFPTFDAPLREAMYEETVLLFMELFRGRHTARELVEADFTFLDARLAKHYGISGVDGPGWRRVDGVRKYGRGGVLALGSVLSQASGASRTSPVLRGNWVVDTLLGERLPKPPANVPRLPEEESAESGTVREMVARHTRAPECAGCHVRIDPLGFSLEKYDPIGRFRDRELSGQPVDVRVTLKDGTQFEGLEGLRGWLLASRRKDFERTFCQKLLGYALGRSVMLSDGPLIEELVGALEAEGTLSEALEKIVQSKQFRYHRAAESTREE